MVSIQLLNSFTNLFAGNKNGYGIHNYIETTQGKEKGKSFTTIKPLLDNLYKYHLEGSQGLGISPITNDNYVNFTVIDYDQYTQDRIAPIIDIIYNYNLPLLPFRSKSGGLHLYLFFESKIKALGAIKLTKQFTVILGLPTTTEIFPKQAILRDTNTIGNWINLPYFNYSKSKQYLIDNNYKKIELVEALNIIKKKIVSKGVIQDYLDTFPLSDAPPCLQSIYLSKKTNYRNEYLFSLARYYKSKYGDDFELHLLTANSELDKPIDTDRLNKTIISSHKKKDYSYRCSNEPICNLCNKEVCKKRKYGIGSNEVSNLSYEEFIQYKTDPPYYEWIVNKKSLKFYSEADIVNQQKFRELCVRNILILPMRLKDETWVKIVNNALSNAVIKEIDPEDDISPGAQFKDYLVEFLESNSMAQSKAQILTDRVYKDDVTSEYIFKAKNIVSFLIIHKQFRHFRKLEIQDRLRRLGGSPKRYYISKSLKSVRVWSLPYKAVKAFINEKTSEDVEVKFLEDKKNKDF